MKNQLSPPVFTIALPVPFASVLVSYVQCTEFGEHALPGRSDDAAPETTNVLALSLVIWFTASATEEVGTSKITSTLSASYHCRATEEPTSGLFWWSADTSSTLSPCFAGSKSSIAICAATTEPLPPMSEYRLDMSDSTPTLTTPSEICACATPVPNAAASASAVRLLFTAIMLLLLLVGRAPAGTHAVRSKRPDTGAASPCSRRAPRSGSCRRRGHGPSRNGGRRRSPRSGNSVRRA